jgi:hypothetical protein
MFGIVKWMACVCLSVAVPGLLQSAGIAQIISYKVSTEDVYIGRYTTNERIREVVANPSKFKHFSYAISIPSKTFNEHYEFFLQNEAALLSLRVVYATNDDVQKLTDLQHLRSLSLLGCTAHDFRPLTKLKKLSGLELANPRLRQFREERLFEQLTNLRTLTLYSVSSLQEAVELPGLRPAASFEEQGLFQLIIHAPQWNPRTRITWPRTLDSLKEFYVRGGRVSVEYDQAQRASISVSRYADDDPAICSDLLRDVIEKSGFYDRRHVTLADVRSRFERANPRLGWQPIVTHDKTDISPLEAFPGVTFLELQGDFYGFDSLKDMRLDQLYFHMDSPTPSAEALEALSEHPTLRKVRQNIESATDKILWERRT